MRFMLIHKADTNTESFGPPPAGLMEALGGLMDEITGAGKLVDTQGLLPSAAGARVRVGGGKLVVTDGPFAESKEVIGGFAIVEVDSKEEAMDIARRWMQIHANVLGPDYNGEAEIRQVFEAGDICR
ncbi:MAG TPA: YciI family protein [Devosiaceae bacterium]|jgi:hypothetical protein